MARADQMLDRFWNMFGLQAYEKNSVPDDLDFPYITYQSVTAEFGYPINLTATIWDDDTSWDFLEQKVEEIRSYISRGGIILRSDDGNAIWVTWGTPFKSRISQNNDIRAVIVNIKIEFLER